MQADTGNREGQGHRTVVAPRPEDPEHPSDEGFQMSGLCLTFCPSGMRRVMAKLFSKGPGQTPDLSPPHLYKGR